MQSSNDRAHEAGDGPGSSAEHANDHGTPARAARREDPWSPAPEPGWGEPDGTEAPVSVVPPPRGQERAAAARDAREVYAEVQRSAAFQEVRGRYRRFVVPGVAVFLGWYVAYVVAATTAPGLMARPVAGVVNVGMLAGLGQFLTTFLFAWAYSWHARLRRDRAALELRWDTQELAREARGGAL
ncbi:DUF485 domain-containing protein [Streptomyces sp. F-1]|uniref:DUF485 domain-containing protein n=1 Tax=Streptomyces sp. F-1 TaxID=463642 RepID=UPI00085C483A|nr:DUF485 domain-containing protein [Streptomyces sp. F-1]SFY51939.1 hypothetical protein STEPF1_05208 [Streptomyces sp. F-1]